MTELETTPESDISLTEVNETTMDGVDEDYSDIELKNSASKLLNDSEDADQQEFNNLSSDSKLERLDNLIKKSQIYSQIIADQIMANTKLKQSKAGNPDTDEGSGNKRRKKDVLQMLSKPKKSDTKQPKLVTGGKLKEYQLDGLEWLITLYENGLNGILADEMGLGKTLQCISFISFLIEHGITGPYLIVAPLSTISNWYKECQKFTPTLKVLQHVGSKEERKAMSFKDYNIVLISYELSIKDFNKLAGQDWKFLIIDEGHRLKNIECVLIKALKKLNVANRLLITGTPLQNNLNELWSLLNFILPDIFHDLQLFQQWFNFDEIVNLSKNPQSGKQDDEVNKFIQKNLKTNLIKNLHTILRPFILRRLKKDVIKNLPPKKEYLIHIELSDYQKKLYYDTLNNELYQGIFELYYKDYQKFNLPSKYKNNAKAKSQLTTGINKTMKTLKLQNLVMQLRSICNSPYNYYDPLPINNETLTSYDKLPAEDKRESIFIEELIANSSKFKVLHQFIGPLLDKGHKVLIFSQFTRTLDLLNDYLNYHDIGLCRFDGSTPQSERDEQIKLFNNKDRKVFLLSTRSGGLGINLTQADTVIIFDNDWNPQMDLQAIDRCHRIGQYKPVKIYMFLIKQSIEELLIIKNYSKRFLEKLIIQMGENTFNQLSNYEIEFTNLIKLSKQFGFMGQTKNQDNKFEFNYDKLNEINLLTQEEINELIDRSDTSFKTSKNYENISVFETINKLDES